MPEFNTAQFNQGSPSDGGVSYTVNDLIYGALRIAGITLAPGRTPSDDQGRDGFELLTGMLGTWAADGIGTPQYADRSDDVAVPLEYRDAMKYGLAERLAEGFPTQAKMSQAALMRSRQLYMDLRARANVPPEMTPDCAIFPQRRLRSTYSILSNRY